MINPSLSYFLQHYCRAANRTFVYIVDDIPNFPIFSHSSSRHPTSDSRNCRPLSEVCRHNRDTHKRHQQISHFPCVQVYCACKTKGTLSLLWYLQRRRHGTLVPPGSSYARVPYCTLNSDVTKSVDSCSKCANRGNALAIRNWRLKRAPTFVHSAAPSATERSPLLCRWRCLVSTMFFLYYEKALRKML